MTTPKKLLLTLITAFMSLRLDAMWLRKPLMTALAKRATTMRMPVIKPVTFTQPLPAKRIVLRAQPRRPFTFKSTTLSKSNITRATTLKRLVGTSVALGALCATASCESDKAKVEKPVAQYREPFEESRKKFYKDLESKPWGEVSKKYIRELQAEEQKLMEEFFDLIKNEGWSKNDWNALLLDLQAFGDTPLKELKQKCPEKFDALLKKLGWKQENWDEFLEEIGQRVFKEPRDKYSSIPQTLKKQSEELAINCSINPEKIKFYETREGFMAATGNSVFIDSRIISMYDHERYSHWQWQYPVSMLKFITLHEYQHILHDDSMLGFCRKLLESVVTQRVSAEIVSEILKSDNAQGLDESFVKRVARIRTENHGDLKKLIDSNGRRNLFGERRADLLAGLVDKEYAAGGITFFKSLWCLPLSAKIFLLLGWSLHYPFHPTNAEREAYMTKLHTEMLAATAK